MPMQNKFFLLFLSSSIFTCPLLEKINLFDDAIKTASFEYEQIFVELDKEIVRGKVYIDRPLNFKIETFEPYKSELILRNEYTYRSDFELKETIRYKTENIKSQVPAFIFLESKKEICKIMTEASSSNSIKNLKLEEKQGELKKISYTDQFETFTEINFYNIDLNNELDKNLFNYNVELDLIIMN
jgi:outer membrane lipoprotein-sorting protein|tara:strand:- start:298 stop:852 length:555 start_codon:yes stop_codon:yes gene_type:complete